MLRSIVQVHPVSNFSRSVCCFKVSWARGGDWAWVRGGRVPQCCRAPSEVRNFASLGRPVPLVSMPMCLSCNKSGQIAECLKRRRKWPKTPNRQPQSAFYFGLFFGGFRGLRGDGKRSANLKGSVRLKYLGQGMEQCRLAGGRDSKLRVACGSPHNHICLAHCHGTLICANGICFFTGRAAAAAAAA